MLVRRVLTVEQLHKQLPELADTGADVDDVNVQLYYRENAVAEIPAHLDEAAEHRLVPETSPFQALSHLAG
jgi:hypothetical protein